MCRTRMRCILMCFYLSAFSVRTPSYVLELYSEPLNLRNRQCGSKYRRRVGTAHFQSELAPLYFSPDIENERLSTTPSVVCFEPRKRSWVIHGEAAWCLHTPWIGNWALRVYSLQGIRVQHTPLIPTLITPKITKSMSFHRLVSQKTLFNSRKLDIPAR